MDGFVFFTLSYFDYSDLQLFAIFIFEVDFSEIYLMTSAEKIAFLSLRIENFLGEDTPRTPHKVRAFGTRDNREFKIRRPRTTATDKHATAYDQNHVTVHFSRVAWRLR